MSSVLSLFNLLPQMPLLVYEHASTNGLAVTTLFSTVSFTQTGAFLARNGGWRPVEGYNSYPIRPSCHPQNFTRNN